MADLQRQVVEKPLNPRAQDMAAGYVEEFADALVLQSKTVATLEGVDEVQGIHVAAARELILKAGKTKSRSSELLALFGAALFRRLHCSSTLVETMRFQRKTFSCYTLLPGGRSRGRERESVQ